MHSCGSGKSLIIEICIAGCQRQQLDCHIALVLANPDAYDAESYTTAGALMVCQTHDSKALTHKIVER